MSVEASAVSQPITISEDEVAREAVRLIAAAAAKHGLATSEIPADLRDRATAEARALLESREKHKSDPYFEMYNESQRRAELAEARLKALRESGTRPEGKVVVETAERARARAGELGWSRMSVEQRLASIGVDHRTVDKVELSQLFGRNSDHKRASDHQRANPRDYATKREAAKILGIF
jgi:hypothetical protein